MCTLHGASVHHLHHSRRHQLSLLCALSLACSSCAYADRYACPCIAGIAPDWDDPQIQHGGLWLAHSSDVVAREQDGQHGPYTIHDAWMDTVMHAIGEQFPDSFHVVGVVFNIRKNGSRLSLWTRGMKNEAAENVRYTQHSFKCLHVLMRSAVTNAHSHCLDRPPG